MADFNKLNDFYKNIINSELKKLLPRTDSPEDSVLEACTYSLAAGGKRVRPVMTLAFADMFKTSLEKVLTFACAIEMIHTFSLIHDDLPSIDNDDFRRGVPTCHKIFGEGMAILAGDALLNNAYEIILSYCLAHPEPENIKAALAIAEATGAKGMIGGQTIDINNEGKMIPIGLLETMHNMKTGSLIKASVCVSAIISNVSENVYYISEKYASHVGLAFQIKDDILDVATESEDLGKTAGKDNNVNKSTYVTLLGLENSKTLLNTTILSAYSALSELNELGYDTTFLEDITEYLLTRKN